MSIKDRTTLLTLAQVSERIQFSTHTILGWVHRKQVGFPKPLHVGPQRERRWRECDIADWLDRQEAKPAPKKLQGVMAGRS